MLSYRQVISFDQPKSFISINRSTFLGINSMPMWSSCCINAIWWAEMQVAHWHHTANCCCSCKHRACCYRLICCNVYFVDPIRFLTQRTEPWNFNLFRSNISTLSPKLVLGCWQVPGTDHRDISFIYWSSILVMMLIVCPDRCSKIFFDFELATWHTTTIYTCTVVQVYCENVYITCT